MLGYFVKAGDLDVAAVFNPYTRALGALLDKHLEGRDYGERLRLIVIQYHLEGRYLELPTKNYKVMPYRKNERALSVVVGVPRSFGGLSDEEKRRFIVDSTLKAVELVQAKMEHLGFTDTDFDSLVDDMKVCADQFLKPGTDELRPGQ